MHGMQYEITLPADYDMEVIRHRVATRGQATDDFPGLGLKAYGIRLAGVDGSPVNQYAPFYLWAASSGMKQFLYGPPFTGIVTDFGRPTVRHGNGLAFALGPAHETRPRAASRTTTQLGDRVSLPDVAEAAVAAVVARGRTAGVHSAAALLDPASWQVVSYTLWEQQAPDDGGDHYELLHLSAPALLDLPQGRQW